MNRRFIQLFFALMLISAYPNRASALIWNMPPIIFDNNASTVMLVADPIGNAYSVWLDSSTVQAANFSTLTETYNTPVVIYTGSPQFPGVACDETGTALLTWNDNVIGQILTSYYNGSSWVTPSPSPLATVPTFSNGFTAVSMDGLGNGLALYADRSGPTLPGNIIASFFSHASQTWGPLQTLTPSGTGGSNPAVAYSSNETAAAIWLDASFSGNVIASNYNGTSWTALPVTIGPTATALTIGIDSSGNALAQWADQVSSNLISSYYTGGVWSAPVTVGTTFFSNYSFAMSAGGTAVAAWTDTSFTGNGFYALFSGGTWGAPVNFSTDVGGGQISAGIDTFGNVLLGWNSFSTGIVYSSYLPVGGPLAPPDLVDSTGALQIGTAALSDNVRGFLSGSFNGDEGQGAGGTYTLFEPAIGGSACTNVNDIADRVHIVTWTASTDPSTVAYYLRRNGVLIAVILAGGPYVYYDHNRYKDSPDVYVITSVNSSGVESNPQIVVLQ